MPFISDMFRSLPMLSAFAFTFKGSASSVTFASAAKAAVAAEVAASAAPKSSEVIA
jgi:hypothetical protein